jgi:2-methylaconitate cis-trans-isomerase PrpF
VVVIRAEDVGLSGTETPAQLDEQRDLLSTLDELRRAGAVAMGLASETQLAERAIPKLALIAAPVRDPQAKGPDLVVRMLSMGKVHPALPITGSVALTLAARVPGTVVADLLADEGWSASDEFVMLTPAGTVATTYSVVDGQEVVSAVRTYRRLVEGHIELPLIAVQAQDLESASA